MFADEFSEPLPTVIDGMQSVKFVSQGRSSFWQAGVAAQ
jgi:hypothetical protein